MDYKFKVIRVRDGKEADEIFGEDMGYEWDVIAKFNGKPDEFYTITDPRIKYVSTEGE